MTKETLIKQVPKMNGTLRLYFQEYLSMWTISWTPRLKAEPTDRTIIKPDMVAHIIKNVNRQY